MIWIKQSLSCSPPNHELRHTARKRLPMGGSQNWKQTQEKARLRLRHKREELREKLSPASGGTLATLETMSTPMVLCGGFRLVCLPLPVSTVKFQRPLKKVTFLFSLTWNWNLAVPSPSSGKPSITCKTGWGALRHAPKPLWPTPINQGTTLIITPFMHLCLTLDRKFPKGRNPVGLLWILRAWHREWTTAYTEYILLTQSRNEISTGSHGDIKITIYCCKLSDLATTLQKKIMEQIPNPVGGC